VSTANTAADPRSDRDNPAAQELIRQLFPAVGGPRVEMLRRVDPEFCRMFQDFVYGGLYTRTVLDQKVRELCALAALAVIGRPTQLRSHIRAAFLAGAAWAEVTEVFIQVTTYAGFPAAIGALDLLEEFRAEFGPAAVPDAAASG
jgi:4-carboxymuconolactone decarboxylase